MDLQQLLDGMTEKLGGREKLQAAPTLRVSGSIAVGPMSGTFQGVQDGRTSRERMEVDLGAFHQVSGYDGQRLWWVDANGKIGSTSDPERIAEHLLEKKFNGNDYLVHRDSYEFSLEERGDAGEYILTVVSVEHRSHPFAAITLHVDAGSLLVVRKEKLSHGHRQVELLGDYREMAGMIIATTTRTVDGAGNETVLVLREMDVAGDADAGIFEPPAEDVRDFRFLDGGTSTVIPIRIPYDHIFVDVAIGGKSYEFVVDTGAGSTVLSDDVVGELGLQSLGTFNAQGVSGPQEISLVKAPEMIVGGVALENQQVIALDFSELNRKLPRMRGLLGMDFLNRFVVKFDYVKGEMEVFDRDSFVYAGNGERLAIDGIAVTMSFDGHEGKFHIDTGAGGIAIHTPFVRKLNLLPRPDEFPSSSSISGVGSVELKTYDALCHRIGIGSFDLADVPVHFTDIDTGAFANEAVIGNVGAVVWRQFITWFDFTGGWMIVEPNTNFHDPFRRSRLGLGLKMDDGRYLVDAVTSRTPAARLGLKRGDELVEIDGRRAADLEIEEIYLLFCAPAGTLRRLKIRTVEGEEREAEVVLEDFVKHYDA